jgi:GNAT superfamily N-acetyltransferase
MTSSSLDRQVADARAALADLERRSAFAKGALTDSEKRDVEAAQIRADPAYQGLGLGRADARLSGELPMQYRARLAEGLQRYAYDENLRKLNLRTLADVAPSAFSNFEAQIITEAVRRGDDGSWSPDGNMREIQRPRPGAPGMFNTEFCGPSTLAWMDVFMQPKRRVRSVLDSRGERRKLDGSLLR